MGFRMAGFKILWANDFDEYACDTYKINFGDHIVCKDIADIQVDSLPKCDVILGGFPCQDFSVIWKRGGIETERGNLYKHYVKIVNAKNPYIFVAENVKGLLSANNRKALDRIVEDFSNSVKDKQRGYNISINLVNFADYGIPQLRERVLIVGVRKDLKQKFRLPEPTHNKNNYVTSKEALNGVETVLFNNEHQNIMPKTIERLKEIPPGGNFQDIPKTSPLYVKGMISHVYRRLHPDKPSTTIIAGGGGGTWGYHFSEPRSLTNRERARLFGFPDDFIFLGSFTEIRRQIGNAVPPTGILPFALAIRKILKRVN